MDEQQSTFAIVKKISQEAHDALYLDLQWPEDRVRAEKLIKPTNLSELNSIFSDNKPLSDTQ